MRDVHAEIAAWLGEAGLAGPNEVPTVAPLTGGVSSDVFRVDLAAGPVCVKAALAQLKVAADWRAPVERSAPRSAKSSGKYSIATATFFHDVFISTGMTWFGKRMTSSCSTGPGRVSTTTSS